MVRDPPFTIGIEEEYLIVDPETRDLIQVAPPELFAECEKRLGGRVAPEFLQSQIEVGTSVCHSVAEVEREIAALRGAVAAVARECGLAVMAASTHPFASFQDQRTTPKERYRVLADDLQEVARRLLISGMHVHVGIDDDDLRVELMSQATYFLPHLLALSTSSPFWHGHKTGLMSYRIAVWDELPRTGLPEVFESFAEYRRHVATLVHVGLIEDGTKLWWDIRPSARFPTLEMRITDVCTRVDDTVCVAALFLCILRMLYRLRRENQRWRRYSSMLIAENRWLAQRYGFEKGLVDFGRGERLPYADLLEELIVTGDQRAPPARRLRRGPGGRRQRAGGVARGGRPPRRGDPDRRSGRVARAPPRAAHARVRRERRSRPPWVCAARGARRCQPRGAPTGGVAEPARTRIHQWIQALGGRGCAAPARRDFTDPSHERPASVKSRA
jgi:carboxylate-amine ligase